MKTCVSVPGPRFFPGNKSGLGLALALLLFVVQSAPAEARLGETIKELRRRYGPSVEADSTKETRTDRYTFRWEVYKVAVTVQDGLSVSEEFTRWDQRDFTLDEVQRLLRESVEPGLAWLQSGGSTWKQQDRTASWAARSLVIQEKARKR